MPKPADLTTFTVFAFGICSASVCTSLDDEAAVARMNAEQPTGIASRWARSTDKRFATGQPNPCRCEDAPDTHRHLLLNC